MVNVVAWENDVRVIRPFDAQIDTATVITPTIEMVKFEAERRILAIVPEWRQRNLLAQATILAEKGRANWSAEEAAAWAAGEAIWAQVASIRSASGTIEQLDPIPHDFANDSRWP